MTPPTFQAVAAVQIDPEPVKVLPYSDIADPISGRSLNYDLYLTTQTQILDSRVLTDRVAKKLEERLAHQVPPGMVAPPEVTRVTASQILYIRSLAPDPELAAFLANTWAEEFLALHAERKRQTSAKATNFLQTQLLNLKEKVESAEQQLVEYARSHEMLNLDAKQENVIRERFSYLSKESGRAEKDFMAIKAEYDSLSGVTEDDFPEQLKNPVILSLETNAFKAEQDLTTLLAQFDEAWPATIRKKEELEVLRRQLSRARADVLSRARKRVEVEYKARQREHELLQDAFVRQASLVDQLNVASVEYNALRRELEASEELYQGLLQRLKETGVSAGLEISNMQIVDPARSDERPYRPNKLLAMALALMLGLTLGVGAALIVDSVDTTIRTPSEAEELGLPTLGCIPTLSNGKSPEPAESLLAPATLRLAAGHGSPKSPQKDATSSVDSLAAECYRSLAASLLLSRAGNPPQVVLLTSPAPNDGKTTTALALAVTLSEMAPTLLVDADLRSPSLSAHFDSRSGLGLSSYLVGADLRLRETDTPNLTFLSSGPSAPNPVALLCGDRLGEGLRTLRNRYRFIIIDSAPVLSVADSTLVAPHSDGVIVVVRADKTPKAAVKETLARLRQNGSSILGFMLTDVNPRMASNSYYRNYPYGAEPQNSGSSVRANRM